MQTKCETQFLIQYNKNIITMEKIQLEATFVHL